MQIDDAKITSALSRAAQASQEQVAEVLKKSKQLQGLNLEDTAVLLSVEDEKLINEIFKAANYVKEAIYGNRIVLFAPLYISNICSNECVYCAFRTSNNSITRRALSQEEIASEVKELLKQGHKRILLVAGEGYIGNSLEYVYKAIDTIYNTEYKGQKIKRVNVNIAPLVKEEFEELGSHNIGTYQLFQETYHRETYSQLHLAGQKKDYRFRLDAIERAMAAGISDVGIGPLLGLYDYKYEVLAMMEHIKYLEDKFGVGPHTISVPRIEPAEGSEISEHPPYAVSDTDFKKLVAVLRLAVPYTGIILSTRETAAMRHELLELGISQMSGGSKTNPGGYEEDCATSQFTLSDSRTLAEVIEDIVDAGHMPSFCTGCYRLGRVGKDFMDLAKPGLIKLHCQPNAILSFAEYLEDFAGERLKAKGYSLIEKTISKDIPTDGLKDTVRKHLEDIKKGKRDIYI
ncbi:2-iminoacetate synthase [Parelusimicrobium proximum]|uniref:[FeFe] hydrogenase H-cluster radical SAM maturase HydG n=1 Tax=Parelusimicrobium proximum TaxID=3228953 RepID=UPI003D162711